MKGDEALSQPSEKQHSVLAGVNARNEQRNARRGLDAPIPESCDVALGRVHARGRKGIADRQPREVSLDRADHTRVLRDHQRGIEDRPWLWPRGIGTGEAACPRGALEIEPPGEKTRIVG